MQSQTKRALDKRKVFAIVAGCAAIGIGATATLAAWTDSEWVFGGNGAGGPGIGTSTFEVQQNTNAAGGFPAASFTDEEENPGGEIVFVADALNLTPGDSVYASVALRAAPGSVAGDVELQPAVPAVGITPDDPAGLLFETLEVAIATDDSSYTCAASAFAGGAGAPTVIGDGPLDSTGGDPLAPEPLEADAGSVQYYCFQITLPDPLPLTGGLTIEDFMGLSVAPAWEFAAISS
jgi:predicted ribosomally synthesized peptide with SipW-like signal peptide